MFDYTVVIPARYASERLPGKPLLDIAGKSMLQWVWEAACKSSAKAVLIATDDERVSKAACAFGAKVRMTAASHQSGSDRIAEVVAGMDDDHIIVNMQGDEPLLPPVLLDQVAAALAARGEVDMATIAEQFAEGDSPTDTAAVKVVCAADGRALYFSRAPLPWPAGDDDSVTCLRHVGVYAYRVSFLRRFVGMPPAPMEISEHLEQLRALYHGCHVHVEIACQAAGHGVDTENDLARVQAIIESGGDGSGS